MRFYNEFRILHLGEECWVEHAKQPLEKVAIGLNPKYIEWLPLV